MKLILNQKVLIRWLNSIINIIKEIYWWRGNLRSSSLRTIRLNTNSKGKKVVTDVISVLQRKNSKDSNTINYNFIITKKYEQSNSCNKFFSLVNWSTLFYIFSSIRRDFVLLLRRFAATQLSSLQQQQLSQPIHPPHLTAFSVSQFQHFAIILSS